MSHDTLLLMSARQIFRGSLPSVGVPRGKRSRGRYVPPPRQISPVPWCSVSQMEAYLGGWEPGEWRLSTNEVGHVQGLPHVVGVKVATWAGRALLWRGGREVLVMTNSNFVPHYEEAEGKVKELCHTT